MDTTPHDHYFTARPASHAERRPLEVELAGRRVRVQTAPGVFCPDRVDVGTRVLFAQAPDPDPEGDLLDLGCGWGPIALTLGLRSPGATVWAVDVNERAVQLAHDNAVALGLGGFRACLPEQVPEGVRFATIWSNPPIRVGKQALHLLLLTWLPRLEAGGSAYLVVQKNLGSDSLQRWLAGELEAAWPGAFAVSRYASARGYRVLEVERTA